MDESELNRDLHDQSQLALEFLGYTRDVEFGYDYDEGDSPATTHELSGLEKEVKESALSCLLTYFVREIGFKPPKDQEKRTNRISREEKKKEEPKQKETSD